jgi:uncharacterized membrane protein
MHLPSKGSLARRIGWVVAWLALGLLSVQFLLEVFGKYHDTAAETYAMFLSRRGWLWTHLAGGMITIVLGPLQFLTRWPRVYPRLHRWTGRVYLGGMLIAATGATGLIATSPAPMEIRTAFAATELAWLTTVLVALVAIYRGQVAVHRRWMSRNYLVTLAPISFRMLLPASIAIGLVPSPALIATLLWLSWALPLLLIESIFRLFDMARGPALQGIRIQAGSATN